MKKAKKTTKKTTKKKTVKKATKSNEVRLDDDELKKLDDAHNKIQIKNLNIQINKEQLKSKKSEYESLELKLILKKQECNQIDATIYSKLKEAKIIMNDYEKIKKEIQEKYELKDKWGYDPITGEVKDE